jgi:hypothetical protein
LSPAAPVSWLPPLRPAACGRSRGHLPRQLLHRQKRNIAHLLANPGFELVRHDVIDPFKFEVDQIYNLACPASPPHYQYNPIKTTKTSVMGAINCLGLAKRVKARVFQASTSEVYGDPQVHPQPESYWGHVNPIGRRSCYDEGKRCAETLFFDYHRENKVDIRVVRIFNTYGPRMHPNDGRVVSNFVVQALRGRGSDDLRRRHPDAVVLLCRRPDRGFCAVHGADRDGRADEPGQPRRVHDAGAGGAHAAAGRRQVEDRPQARCRPTTPPAAARHCTGEARAAMGAEGAAGRGLQRTIEYFRERT